jgi:hypothetical protein
MSISGLEVARAHWLFGALFLAMVLDEVGSTLEVGTTRRPSYYLPLVLLLAGAGMWGASVFANSVIDAVVHSLWGDVLLAAGSLELQRRRGRLRAWWGPLVVPIAVAVCGGLFLAHSDGPLSDPAARWHVLMGWALVMAGTVGVVWVRRQRRGWLMAYGTLLAAFSFLLLTFPR